MAKKSLMPWRRNKEVSSPRDPFLSFRREMDDMLERFIDGHGFQPFSDQEGFAPAVDVKESDKEIVVTAEVPGIEEKDLDLSLRDDMLTIKGEKKSEREEKDKDQYYSERIYGSFQRTIQLPSEVDADKVSASHKKGVLTITLPKNPAAAGKTKKIEIAG